MRGARFRYGHGGGRPSVLYFPFRQTTPISSAGSRLSFTLQRQIHEQRALLARGPQEAELRAVALAACEQIVTATEKAITALDLGYYLWLTGKEPGKRQFPRHHIQDTVFIDAA